MVNGTPASLTGLLIEVLVILGKIIVVKLCIATQFLSAFAFRTAQALGLKKKKQYGVCPCIDKCKGCGEKRRVHHLYCPQFLKLLPSCFTKICENGKTNESHLFQVFCPPFLHVFLVFRLQ
jgi:hypothetical protein